MKQYITIAQWDELTHEEKNILDDFGCKHDYSMTIGQMIWFLGDDFENLVMLDKNIGWEVLIGIGFGEYKVFEARELITTLWEAVKYKLKVI